MARRHICQIGREPPGRLPQGARAHRQNHRGSALKKSEGPPLPFGTPAVNSSMPTAPLSSTQLAVAQVAAAIIAVYTPLRRGVLFACDDTKHECCQSAIELAMHLIDEVRTLVPIGE